MIPKRERWLGEGSDIKQGEELNESIKKLIENKNIAYDKELSEELLMEARRLTDINTLLFYALPSLFQL